MNQHITNINELLSREAALSAQQLGIGLTSIRKYNFTSKGVFYSGMFSLTIGLERILKIILLLDYHISNGSYPNDNKFLRRKGHNIQDLIKECNLIKNKFSVEKHEYPSSQITKEIITFLSDFATTSRYYNLDVIIGDKKTINEPLARWDSDICSLILKKHPPSKKKIDKYKNLADMICDISFVDHTLDDGMRVNDAHTFFEQSAFVEDKQAYSVLYLYKIVQYSLHTLKELDYKMNPQLCLREHFLNLEMANLTTASILRRKNWSLNQ